jgi:hypothetical protein
MKVTSLDRSRAARFDQYYTQRPVAKICWEWMSRAATAHGVSLNQSVILEPSAGAGAFLDTAPLGMRVAAFDIDPPSTRPDVTQHDFLRDLLPHLGNPGRDGKRIVIGNPPFGRKATLANAFIAHSWAEAKADLVAFILPVQFRKWSAQRHVDLSARLIADFDLPEDSFEFAGKPCKVRCCFQLWASPKWPTHPKWPDLRLRQPPPTQHADFDAYQFNRMPGSDKCFGYDWDFAVPRQGYVDYTRKVFSTGQCSRKQQWILFKAHSPRALRRLMRLDFVALSRKNTGVPGFGKADVVEAYGNAEAIVGRRSRGRFPQSEARRWQTKRPMRSKKLAAG